MEGQLDNQAKNKTPFLSIAYDDQTSCLLFVYDDQAIFFLEKLFFLRILWNAFQKILRRNNFSKEKKCIEKFSRHFFFSNFFFLEFSETHFDLVAFFSSIENISEYVAFQNILWKNIFSKEKNVSNIFLNIFFQ